MTFELLTLYQDRVLSRAAYPAGTTQEQAYRHANAERDALEADGDEGIQLTLLRDGKPC